MADPITYALTDAGSYGLKGGNYVDVLEEIVETWEDGDTAEWDIPNSMGSVNTTAAHSGTYGFEAAEYGDMYSDSGLANYPQKGDIFEIWMNPGWNDQGVIWRMHWARQTAQSDDCYTINFEDNAWSWECEEGGSTTNSASGSFSQLSEGTWYKTEVVWDDGTLGGADGDLTMTLTRDDGTQIDQMTANDTTYSSGGVGFWASGYNDNLFIDDWIITSPA